MADENQKMANQELESLPPVSPRFSLLGLFGGIAVIAVALAAWNAVGPIVGAAILVFVLAIAGHIAGNAIGSQLRDGTTERLRRRSQAGSHERSPPKKPLEAQQFAPVTQLSHRKPLGLFMIFGTAFGIVAGAVLGGYAMYRANEAHVTFMGMAVGCAATGTLGGLWAFWSCSLTQVVFGAWREATSFSKQNRER